jgi:hypothetical protein
VERLNIFILLNQMLVLLAMMLVGYFIYAKKWITNEGAASLSKIVVNVMNPLLIINSVLGDNSQMEVSKLWVNFGMILFFYIVVILFSFLLVLILHPDRHLRPIYLMMATFPNLGFMGIPVIRSIYGDEAILYVAFYMLVYNVLAYTYGFALARKGAVSQSQAKRNVLGYLRRIINPGVVGSLVAFVILAFGISVPTFVSGLCDYMGNATIPLSMLTIGFSIARADLKSYWKDVRIYAFTVLRMVFLPIAFAVLLKQTPLDATLRGVFVLELAMPVGSMNGMIVQECGADPDYCMKGTTITTLLSVFTIPLVGLFL